jgi:hypothetical protein
MKYAYNHDLPQSIRKVLPYDAQSVFRNAYNRSIHLGKTEAQASCNAWLAAERSGRWTPTFKKTQVSTEANPGFSIYASITKVDEEQQMVYGFASVIEENGQAVVDLQDDVITEKELIKAAHEFMRNSRDGHSMHAGITKGDIPESIVLTKTLQAALGVDIQKVGWLIGYHVSDPDTWDRVKKGELQAFSIGGSALRELLED